MGSTWLCIPSARPPEEAEKVLQLWRQQCYKIALFRDDYPERAEFWHGIADQLFGHGSHYPGYAAAVNAIIRNVVKIDPSAEWFVIGGDDVQPDLNHSAEEIAEQCKQHFFEVGLLDGGWKDAPSPNEWSRGRQTFGVMQPTGDRWQEGMGGFKNALIDRVCGSAWIGRDFATRMYQGNGPLWPGYHHMFVDEELQEVAIKMGVLWQRRDLIQIHNHVLRHPEPGKLKLSSELAKAPHLAKWNTPEHWNESKKLFQDRKAAGFPGSDPL